MAIRTLYDLAIRNEAGEYVVDPERFSPMQFTKEDAAYIQAQDYYGNFTDNHAYKRYLEHGNNSCTTNDYDEWSIENRRLYNNLYPKFNFAAGEAKLVRHKNLEWRARERERFSDGEYEGLPCEWADLEPITDHFAHLSTEDGAQVAFTPDEGKGQLDIQVRMKPGRYLNKFYPHLTGDQVRALACAMDKATEVKFAVTEDDLRRSTRWALAPVCPTPLATIRASFTRFAFTRVAIFSLPIYPLELSGTMALRPAREFSFTLKRSFMGASMGIASACLRPSRP
jgi:hypothetical protein